MSGCKGQCLCFSLNDVYDVVCSLNALIGNEQPCL